MKLIVAWALATTRRVCPGSNRLSIIGIAFHVEERSPGRRLPVPQGRSCGLMAASPSRGRHHTDDRRGIELDNGSGRRPLRRSSAKHICFCLKGGGSWLKRVTRNFVDYRHLRPRRKQRRDIHVALHRRDGRSILVISPI